MPTKLTDIGKYVAQVGSTALLFALLVFYYMHKRGYADAAADEMARVMTALALFCTMLPPPKINTGAMNTNGKTTQPEGAPKP